MAVTICHTLKIFNDKKLKVVQNLKYNSPKLLPKKDQMRISSVM